MNPAWVIAGLMIANMGLLLWSILRVWSRPRVVKAEQATRHTPHRRLAQECALYKRALEIFSELENPEISSFAKKVLMQGEREREQT